MMMMGRKRWGMVTAVGMEEEEAEAKEEAGVAALVVVRSALAVTMMAMVEVEVEGSLSFKGQRVENMFFDVFPRFVCVFD